MNLAVDLLTGGRDVMTSAQAKVTKIHLKHCVQKLAEAEMNLTRIARAATGIGNIFVLYSKLYFTGCYFSWSPCVSHYIVKVLFWICFLTFRLL